VAEGLQARGYRVFASARNPEDVSALQQHGLECVQLDLADSDSIAQAVNTVLSRTDGQLYGLFNNGGYAQPGAVEDLSRNALREQFETNLFGWQELTNLVIPAMRRQGYGRIIYNSSILGMIPMSYRGAYVASKYAIEGLAGTLRLELAGTGIHVCLIEPGPIVSKIRENSLKAFKRNIDTENSAHREQYRNVLARLETEGPVMESTLPPTAVLKRVILALEKANPQPHYYVTTPTYMIGFLRRILPHRLMERLLLRSSGGGKR
jgi:NAD(P)-dependent dehydrogenase (short-subunit alcohol dehydrogenase family)